jgi:glycosyltransferase involved in cell wall biosynthesis
VITPPIASVIIPAYNEGRTVGRLLTALIDPNRPDEFEIVVMCNGCTDDTAAIARTRGETVRVVELDEPSKHRALVEGDRLATVFPRLYVDGDVELDADGARALVASLSDGRTLAAAPQRRLVLDHSTRAVRSYYRVWERLPVVRSGLFGRGVVALSAEGHRRLADRPEVLGDDLYVHSRFTAAECRIVPDAWSRVHGPRHSADLIRRRTRAAQGNVQLAVSGDAPTTTNGTARSLLQLARAEPRLLPHLPAFLGITAASRINRRLQQLAGRDQVWLRDESSREERSDAP